MVNCHSETTQSRGARNTSRKSNVRSWNGRRCSRLNSASAICFLPTRRRNRRQGQALLEFAILIPLIIILIGATLSFGLFFFQANVLQQAVDVAAQEISRMPFEPDQELGLGQLDQCGEPNLVSNDPDFKSRIYDEQYLVIHDDEWGSSTSYGGNFQSFADQLPLLNRLLVSSMIRDNDMTRFPGTIVVNNSTGEETVLIPIVEYSRRADDVGQVPTTIRAAGEIVVEWVAPVEEIRVDHDQDASTSREGPFKLSYESPPTLASFQPGMVALRINYPAQSTTLINRITDSGQVNGQLGGVIVIAGDTTLASGATTGCYSIVAPSARISPASGSPGSNANAGLYGLGELEALTRVVRPYRKVMSFQAIYRREVFGDGT